MEKNFSKGVITAQKPEVQSTKMKTYRTLFVTISKDKYHKDFEVHRFPYSSDEKANAAFDSWVAKAKEVLEDRLESFQDLSDEFQKEASFRTDDGIQIDVNVQDDYWDTLKTVPLDQEMEELEKKNQEWIDTKIKEAIKDLADVFYTHPEENVYKSALLDEVEDCVFDYGISSEEVSEFSKNHSIVAIYCNYLEDAGEITDWEWDGPNRNYAKLVLSEQGEIVMEEIYDYCFNFGYQTFMSDYNYYDEDYLPRPTPYGPEDFYHEFGDDAKWDYDAEYAGIAQGLKEKTGKDYTIEFDGSNLVALEK